MLDKALAKMQRHPTLADHATRATIIELKTRPLLTL